MKRDKNKFIALVYAFVFGLTFSISGFAQDGISNRLHSGPKEPGEFGAYYTTLKYDEGWDKPWRIGPQADIVVRFDTGIHKFRFGHRHTFEGIDLIVWIETESRKQMEVVRSPAD